MLGHVRIVYDNGHRLGRPYDWSVDVDHMGTTGAAPYNWEVE